MILKDMHVRENLVMENNHRLSSGRSSPTSSPLPMPTTTTSHIDATTTFTNKRGCLISLTTILILGAFFICSLVAVSFIIYNFAACDQLTPAPGENVVCTTVRMKQQSIKLNYTDEDNYVIGPEGKRSKYDTNVRLPRSIKPLSYNISLVPHLHGGNFTFDGTVNINVLVAEDCYNITLHATELNISKNDVFVREVLQSNRKQDVGTSDLRIRKQYLVDSKQFFVIELYDKLARDKLYEIGIKFNGLLQDYLQGFYRSSYTVGNETRWLASTQFQATDARRAFPCFDEPHLKANFTLHIARTTNMTTISNMPIVSTTKHEKLTNYVWDHFAESLPMSTYLVAYATFISSDFQHLSEKNFSVWARANTIQSAQYALSVGPRILKFLEEYFAIEFPLAKIDMIALPEFQAGAMENWGLITYRETTMLFEEGVSATTNKQRIASVVGHELAHQWFGNLVTPSWWSDIWLNEGFASYMEYLTVDAIEPSWKTLDQFVVNELQNVFQLDALSTSHKISVEVLNPDEISEIFDRISYAKGCTIIRMMSHFLTSKVFRQGLSKYLREMAYSSAGQDDLWRFLTNEAISSGLLDRSISVKQIMDTWTLQMGYPVLKVREHPNSHVLLLEQERFVFENLTQTNFGALWWIPITYTSSAELDFENTRPITWIPCTKSYEIENRNLTIADWFIFNIQQTGYYRVNYELQNWNSLASHLNKPDHYKEIAPANRAQLIDDSMNLAKGSYLTYDIPLNLSRYLVHEENHVPWKAAISAFNFIDSMFINQGDYDLLKNYLLSLLKNVYKEVSFENGVKELDMLKLFKQSEILNMACHLGHQSCISSSFRLFMNWSQASNPDNYNPISPNLRGIVYCSAIEYSTEQEWDFAFERYLNTNVSTEKELLLSALGCSKQPWILFRYLRRSISGGTIRKQDVYRVFAAVSNNVVGQRIAFDFIRTNWEEIKNYLGSTMSNMNMILKFATKNMNSKFMLNELKSFVINELKENGRPIRQIVEQVQGNVNWMNRNYKTIVKWLKENIQM